MANRAPLRLEAVLRSSWGQVAFVVAVVLVVSLAMSVPRFEIAELRGREFDRGEVFLRELLRWGAWGIASWPILRCARWILDRSGSWLLLLALQLPLSGLCGWGFLHLTFRVHQTVFPERSLDDRRPEDRPFDERRPLDDRRAGERPFDDRRPGDRPGPPFDGERSGPPDRGPGPPWRRGPRFPGDAPEFDSIFWRQRWMSAVLVYWVVLGMGAGLTSFLGLRERERQAAELELRAERLRAELAQSRLGSLRNQLNPHFLFNALHSVGGLVRAGRDPEALRTLSAIGDLLRSTLDHGGAEETGLAEELDIAQRYLEIERIRLGERLRIELEVDEGARLARVPTLLLLPLVENAVRHGIAPRPEGGRVVVRAARHGDQLELEVEDDGDGFAPDALASAGPTPESSDDGRRSIGLANTRARLRAHYGDEQSFELENVPTGGARVRLRLPFRTKERPDSPAESAPGEPS